MRSVTTELSRQSRNTRQAASYCHQSGTGMVLGPGALILTCPLGSKGDLHVLLTQFTARLATTGVRGPDQVKVCTFVGAYLLTIVDPGGNL